MVSYYPSAYRQQGIPAQSTQMHTSTPMHSWYTGSYHPQAPQVMPPPSYCMQEEQPPQVWSHTAPHVFHQEYMDFNSLPLQHVPPQYHQQHAHPHTNHNLHTQQQQQHNVSSPPITVSGSDTSSPGTVSGTISPQNTSQNRPVAVRSPFEWIKKTGYQSQPNPGKTRTKDKYRVVYTDHQRVELEKEFYYSRYITIRRKAELANTLGLSERQVKIWFQNRRAKERKQGKKRDEFTHKDIIHLQQSQQIQQHQQQGIIDQQIPPQLM